jgi:hypothetical protein
MNNPKQPQTPTQTRKGQQSAAQSRNPKRYTSEWAKEHMNAALRCQAMRAVDGALSRPGGRVRQALPDIVPLVRQEPLDEARHSF